MIQRDPNIVKSRLSRTVKKDGVTVEVSIIRLEHESEWSLEVINSARHVHSLGRTLCNRRKCLRRIRADCRRGRDAGVPRQRKRDPNAPLIATCARKSAASRVFRGRPSTPQRLCAEEGRSRRNPAVADRDLGRLNSADSAPTRVASGRTGVRAKAVIGCEREKGFTAFLRHFAAPPAGDPQVKFPFPEFPTAFDPSGHTPSLIKASRPAERRGSASYASFVV